MKRLTTKIKGSNNYCKFELKNAKYKNLFELSSNREIEDYVNSDLTIAIDKLGQLEDIEEMNELLKKLQEDFDTFNFDNQYYEINTEALDNKINGILEKIKEKLENE